MDFEDAPRFLLAPEIRAKRFMEAKNISISGPDGVAADAVFVPAGHWAFREEGGTFELPDEDFRARFEAVASDPKSFVERRRAVRAVVSGGFAHVEGLEAPMPLSTFILEAVRADADGRPLCRLSSPLHSQARFLLSLRSPDERHLASLEDMAAALRSSVQDAAMWTDLNMLDAVLARPKDGVSDGMAEIYAARPPSGVRGMVETADGRAAVEIDARSVRAAMAEGIGVHPMAIGDVVRSPVYLDGSFRALVRGWLKPYLGPVPLEDVLVMPVPAGEAGEDLRRAMERWTATGELVATGPKARMDGPSGYETSPIRHYRIPGGVDAVMFEDMVGVYVYAWRTPPVPNLDGDGAAGPRGPGLH